MQPNSAVLVLQYSADLVDAWAGLMLLDKDKNSRFWFSTKKVLGEEQAELLDLLEKFRAFRNFALKNPIADETEQENHWTESEQKLEEIIKIVKKLGS